MPSHRLLTVLFGTFLAMGVLYGPQPLLPLLSRVFGVSEAASASLITWSLFAMSFGPLCMGFLLQKYQARHMIVACLLGLGSFEILFAFIDSFEWLKVLRFVQGAFISALLAATMTYMAALRANLRQNLAYYVAGSVLGGLSGRILAGFISENLSWPFFFLIMGSACILSGLLVGYLAEREKPTSGRAFSLSRLFGVLKDGFVLRFYAIVFLGFFVMTATLNFVPFRLEELDETLGEASIALFYLGFVVGFAVSGAAPKIAGGLGGVKRTFALGLACVASGLLIGAIDSVVAVFIAVLLVTSGFFLQHATIAGSLNSYAGDRAGDVNSLYVSFYYIGGTAGSYLPGLLYVSAGWTPFVLLLLAIVMPAALLVFGAEGEPIAAYGSETTSN